MCGRPKKPDNTRVPEAVLFVLGVRQIEIEDLANLAMVAMVELCKGIDLSPFKEEWATALSRLNDLGASVGYWRLHAVRGDIRAAYRELERA